VLERVPEDDLGDRIEATTLALRAAAVEPPTAIRCLGPK
jgi:hypothetical protein